MYRTYMYMLRINRPFSYQNLSSKIYKRHKRKREGEDIEAL